MTDLLRDQNFRTIGGAVASDDADNVLPIKVNPTNDWMLVHVTLDSLTPTVATMDKRDQNFKPTMYGVSSVDGVTPVPIRTDENGLILVELE